MADSEYPELDEDATEMPLADVPMADLSPLYPQRRLSESETWVLAELWKRNRQHVEAPGKDNPPTHAYVTALRPVHLEILSGAAPPRIVPAGQTLKIVMVSRFGDMGLTDDLTADFGYQLRIFPDHADFVDIRWSVEPTAEVLAMVLAKAGGEKP